MLLKPELGLIFWQVIIFLIILWLLTKFAWKPILKALDGREKKIDDALRAAEHAQIEMRQLADQRQKQEAEAQAEIARRMKEAKEMADKMVADARDKAAAEYEIRMKAATQDIANQKSALINDVKNQMGGIIIELAEKVLHRELADKQAQTGYIKDMVEQSNLN